MRTGVGLCPRMTTGFDTDATLGLLHQVSRNCVLLVILHGDPHQSTSLVNHMTVQVSPSDFLISILQSSFTRSKLFFLLGRRRARFREGNHPTTSTHFPGNGPPKFRELPGKFREDLERFRESAAKPTSNEAGEVVDAEDVLPEDDEGPHRRGAGQRAQLHAVGRLRDLDLE